MNWNNHFYPRKKDFPDRYLEKRNSISEVISMNNIEELKSLLSSEKASFTGANLSLQNESAKVIYPRLKYTTYHYLSNLILIPKDNLTAMHIAAFSDSLESFVILEKEGFDINAPSAANYLPIHYACVGGSLEIASYILSKKKEHALSVYDNAILIIFFYPIPILFLAVLSNNSKIVTLLFKHGLKFSPSQYTRYNPFDLTIQCKSVDIMKILLKYSTFEISKMEDTWIMKAIRINQPETIPLLLEIGDDPEKIIKTSTGEYESALSICCKSNIKNKEEIARLIVEKSSVLDIDENIQAAGAVHWICESKSPQICKMVLEKGIKNINRFDQKGLPGPSRLIDMKQNEEKATIEILSTLIMHGYDINGICKTVPKAKPLLALFCRSIIPSLPVIEWLIKNGADPYLQYTDDDGVVKTTMSIAKNKRKLVPVFAKFVQNSK